MEALPAHPECPDVMEDPFKFDIPRLSDVLKVRAEFDRVASSGDVEAEK